jgi:nitroimidazol reductase NimA-like FMN-containing flavoprotein (pyridoxamine 5'-phosphate oxidase superfamily)
MMRRKKQEVSNPEELEAIFREAGVCRLAMMDGNRPYMVPLNFGYRDNVLYFHSAGEGKKIDLLRRYPQVCFEVEAGVKIIPGGQACNWGVSFRSIIGHGRAEFVTDADEKRRGLDIIMAHYSDGEFEYSDENLQRTTVVKVEICSMTGKRSAG